MKYALLFAVLLTACQTAPAVIAPITTNPVLIGDAGSPVKPAVIETTCPTPGIYQAADLSMPVDQKFLDVAKYLGIKTIIRYGDYEVETIKGKTPKLEERKLIQANGFSELFVFQHNNNLLSSFTPARGKADAERMLQLYREVPAWYYGVDGDFYKAEEQAKVRDYAVAFKAVADTNGKDVGVYGSGTILSMLGKAGLAKYFWVSQSTGFSGTKEYTAAKKYHLLQGLPKKCGGKELDFNVVNLSAFGEFEKNAALKAMLTL